MNLLDDLRALVERRREAIAMPLLWTSKSLRKLSQSCATWAIRSPHARWRTLHKLDYPAANRKTARDPHPDRECIPHINVG